MGTCSEPIDISDGGKLDTAIKRVNITTETVLAIQAVVAIAGVIYVLGCSKSKERSCFVKVLYSLIFFGLSISISITIVNNTVNAQNATWSNTETFLTFLNECCNSLIHWVFALKYFELALSFPLLLGQLP